MEVKVINNDVEGAIRKLKKALHNDGIIKEVLRRRFYEKPSEKRRRKRAESIQKAKIQRRAQLAEF